MPDSPKRFVVLRHVLPEGSRHWDLCLDQGQTLATWQLLKDPATLVSGQANVLPARRIADHRRAYLDYEGPVSGDRGHVSRVDHGSYTLLDRQADLWRIRFAGCLLIGTFEITAGGDSSELGILQRAE